ncbi:beta-1,6-N-acetylglucosaminyltransferase [Heyndrickxia oleronia]|uniref:Peptide O-xylosyltransferase n=1 Tax=Heyndrickxia oleronia TaxID=38875 RepID=A0AAW6SQ53_9BACI|nr:beta-1,6-N-acetylglucosaminyltransferase [Heyndrickxia oleronia]MDH5159360.1 beta-1,6-N-acetylglucosaminyltransferase [Heyndrickxia oleronia]
MNTLRTAFLLQVHKNPEQVNAFIEQLISENHADVYVHIDKKNNDQLCGEIVQNDRIHILQNNISCDWGDISQIDTTILLLKEVLSTKRTYDFIILRSGQDLLVKNGFKEFLSEHKGTIFMTFYEKTKKNLASMKVNWPKITRRRYTTFHPYRLYRRSVRLLYEMGINMYPNMKPWPEKFTFYHGSQWFCIPFEVAKYIIEFLETNEWYYEYFKNTLVPDEWFFQTLIMHSHFKHQVVNDNLMFLKWGETFRTGNSPLNISFKDIKLIQESNSYFARKFDGTFDQSVIEYFTKSVYFGRENKREHKQIQ